MPKDDPGAEVTPCHDASSVTASITLLQGRRSRANLLQSEMSLLAYPVVFDSEGTGMTVSTTDLCDNDF